MSADNTVRFYFSFRSPYAWFAAELIEDALAGLSYRLEPIPIYPSEDTFPNDPARTPNKLRYVMIETDRIAREHGLPHRYGYGLDTHWAKAHAAFLGAHELGRGLPFMRAMFRQRFSHARDVGDDAVIRDAAREAELDEERVLEASCSLRLQAMAAEGFALGQKRDQIFGVPSFVHEGQLYWGHDRLAQLRRALSAREGAA